MAGLFAFIYAFLLGISFLIYAQFFRNTIMETRTWYICKLCIRDVRFGLW